MLPASNKAAGIAIGFPDICLTPAAPAPIPTPYPNLAMNAMAAPFAATVKVSMVNALNMGSEIPMTSGDEAGAASPIKGPGRYTTGNPIVHVEALPAIHLLCPTSGNNMNNALGAVLVPSVTNVFYTHASGTPVLDGAALGELVRALDVKADFNASVDRGVLYLRIPIFSADVPARVFGAVRALSHQKIERAVIDLRDNPGGELTSFIELAGDFLEEGQLVATLVDADGDETVYRARTREPYAMPLVVVVNGGTASAAELFAGCLQAHGRAVIAGETTYGKGIVQTLLPSVDGAAYAFVARALLPDGRAIHGVGVRPDVVLDPRLDLEMVLRATLR